jgi:predicted nucleic acid-binding protein
VLVLDSGGLSRLAQRSRRAAALIEALRAENLWPPVVPTIVLAESTTGAARTDTNVNRLLKTCDVDPIVSERAARRAGHLRARARRGSAVDALVVALAEPGGTVITGDAGDLEPLAAAAVGVTDRGGAAARPRPGGRR